MFMAHNKRHEVPKETVKGRTSGPTEHKVGFVVGFVIAECGDQFSSCCTVRAVCASWGVRKYLSTATLRDCLAEAVEQYLYVRREVGTSKANTVQSA